MPLRAHSPLAASLPEPPSVSGYSRSEEGEDKETNHTAADDKRDEVGEFWIDFQVLSDSGILRHGIAGEIIAAY